MSIEARLQLQQGNFELDVTLDLPGSGVSALFGRSGSGKTTILRCLAGLERHAGIELRVNGEIWQSQQHFVPVHQRPLGYVFQEASLFPHLTVAKNLEFGYRRLPPAQRKVALDETISLMGLETLLARYPQQLSGGQRQRVAMARALLTSPRLLLMDEPMAALDQRSKAEILPYLERLHQHLAIPIIYVSHAIHEVCRLADYLVLLEQGKVQAQGPLQQLLTQPDLPLAQDADAASMLLATVLQHTDDEMSELQLPDGQRLLISRLQLAEGQNVRTRILARDVAISLVQPQFSSVNNCLRVELEQIEADPHPGHQLLVLRLAGQPLLARLSRRSVSRLQLQPGQQLFAQIKAVALD
ncbi:molybdenum ABC transporter ATP-binding protein [Alishewanella sp. HH-ZS]|uniref:molybdenum ABC transporter ATP-binding protein n=1 Tax=Alishewanella sp. HH-ZS TaxID=1856684 RepID=UPI0008236E5C|nr:molybdenum ABC transporter ATP-binding protein [Alishewanella sp. HH-ZS]OCW98404.1 molybdenum ABC transporter ATP-binding protein [Alishewanella sp. HH-ZS]